MKKLIFSVFAFFAAVGGYAQIDTDVASATGEKMEWLPSFTDISVKGPLKIKLIQIPTTEAPHIVYDLKGIYTSGFTATVNKDKMLEISEKYDSKRSSVTDVTVYYNTLTTLRFTGANVTIEKPIAGIMTDMVISGGSVVDAALDVKDLHMEVTGKSRVVLTGDVRYFTLKISSAKLDASRLAVMSADISASNKAEAVVDVSERLEAVTSTSGVIKYGGSPEIVRAAVTMFGGEIISLK